jgi:hypothetical protein
MVIGSGALPAIQRHPAGFDLHFTTSKIDSVPFQAHNLRAAQTAES